MSNFEEFQLTVSGFKCFGSESQGFERIAPFNIIIGRNNSGKSSLLDLLPILTQKNFKIPKELWHDNDAPKIFGTAKMSEDVLRQVFPETTRGGSIPTRNHWDFGKQFVDTEITWQIGTSNKFVSISECPNGNRPLDRIQDASTYLAKMANVMPNPFANREFVRISPERNINPEMNNGSLEVEGNGTGVTNLIQSFINKARLPSSIVEETLLEHLNRIFSPDTTFTEIVCQQLDTEQWEIYLTEQHKGRIALSLSGHGIKTVIIVLVHLLLVPNVKGKNLDCYVFACEELENNLHPALLRRLLSYLFEYAKNHGAIFFLTTHSSVAIDLFSRKREAQIIHVKHDGQKSRCQTVKTYVDNHGVLDDLDIRASDLLQSNGIIWVEGPSDRIYVTRWIELYSRGELVEGLHFQCVFYGGRLLSHLNSVDPEENVDGIAVLRVNRNCCVIMDSDMRSEGTKINDTKRRIESEIMGVGGISWITNGREIENYLPADVITLHLEVSAEQVGRFDEFADYLENLKADAGKEFLRKKPLFAENIIAHMTRENAFSVLDLETQLAILCASIRRWNGLPTA